MGIPLNRTCLPLHLTEQPSLKVLTPWQIPVLPALVLAIVIREIPTIISYQLDQLSFLPERIMIIVRQREHFVSDCTMAVDRLPSHVSDPTVPASPSDITDPTVIQNDRLLKKL